MIRPDRPQTTAAVAAHYDELDPFYREIWGEHVHHGYWATGRESPEPGDRRTGRPGRRPARPCRGRDGLRHRLRLWRDRAARGRAPRRPRRGSPCRRAQAAVAAARVPAGGTGRDPPRDWLANGLPDGVFDRAYAIESTEHMEDMRRFFAEAARTIRNRAAGSSSALGSTARSRARGRCAGCSSRSAARAGWPASATRPTTAASPTKPASPPSPSRTSAGACRGPGPSAPADWRPPVITRPRYRRFLLDIGASNRVFAITLLRILLAYRTGAMRYGLFLFARPR